MRISDWSSDVCSSDLDDAAGDHHLDALLHRHGQGLRLPPRQEQQEAGGRIGCRRHEDVHRVVRCQLLDAAVHRACDEAERPAFRSEEHTSELQSLMRISYAVFCLKKKKYKYYHHII